MSIRTLAFPALFIFCPHLSRAQELTVHVINEASKQPVSNALVRLHYGCTHSMRPIELKQKTNAVGMAIFHAVTLTPYEFCVFPDYAYASQEQPLLFASPREAENYNKYAGKVFTTLPAEVSFHVRRLSVAERIRNLFRND
jgi:hypothetical protein